MASPLGEREAARTALPPGEPEAAFAHPILRDVLRRGQRLRRLDQRRPWLLNLTVVLLVIATSLADLVSGGAHAASGHADSRHEFPAVVPWILAVAAIVPLWWRRRAPTAVFFVVTAVSLVTAGLGIGLTATFVSSLVALYAMARLGRLRLLGPAVALAAIENIVVATTLVPRRDWVGILLFLLGMVTAVAAIGLTLRTRRMYLTALEDRARRLEIERDQRTRLTAAAERTRVAREMHDIVGHTLSVMVTLADGAAALAARDNEHSAEALRTLGDTGRQAMNELRRVLGALRDDRDGADARLTPQPTIGDLDTLLARVRAAGLPVTYRTTGDLAGLSSGLQLTVYRIVQESLTNTLKHAGTAATSEVSVTAEGNAVTVRVTDTGAPVEGTAPALPALETAETADPVQTALEAESGEGGHGLIGIRQRAALYHGSVTIGPRRDHPGWIVDVRLDTTVEPTELPEPPGPTEPNPHPAGESDLP